MPSTTKTCIECAESKALQDFYAHPTNPDGYAGVCKVCHRARMKRRRMTNPAVQAYDRKRSSQPHRRANTIRVSAAWRAANPDAYRAHNAVNNAIRDGRMARGERCEVEGCDATTGLHAHHDDYSKPLVVRWKCPLHHHREHASALS